MTHRATVQDYKYLVHAPTLPVQGARSSACTLHTAGIKAFTSSQTGRRKARQPGPLFLSHQNRCMLSALSVEALAPFLTDVVVSTEAELISWQTSGLFDHIQYTVFEKQSKTESEMKRQRGLSLLALWALFLLCTLHQTASFLTTPSQVSSSDHLEKPLGGKYQTNNSFKNGSQSLRSRPAPKLKEALGHVTSSSLNTSRDNNTVIPKRSHRAHSWSPEEGVSPLCAYRVIEGGIGGQLCFRRTLPEYKCHEGECRTVVSFGNLVANILINGSVLLQWTQGSVFPINGQDNKTNSHNISKYPGTNLTTSHTVFSGPRHRRGGFELSCWWNGSYTQFECTGVQLAHGCRDYLLTELHENIPYRICLRSLDRSPHRSPHRPQERDCVEFTLPPSGMQDIVIAMTTVGGAICVMLVIICLLVAYITENIMSPTTVHTYPYRTHSRH